MESQIPEESRVQTQKSRDEERKGEAGTSRIDRQEEVAQEAKTTPEEEATIGLERVVTSVIREHREREEESKTVAPDPKLKTPAESPAVEISSSEPPSEKKRKRIPRPEPRVRSQRSAAGTSSRGGESKSRGDSALTQRRYDSFSRINFIDERRLLNPEEVYLAKSLLSEVNLLSSVTDVSSYDKKLLCEFWTGLPAVKTEEESVEVNVEGIKYEMEQCIFEESKIETYVALYQTQVNCRTDMSNLISSAPWIKIPYPLQLGAPSFDAGHVFRYDGFGFSLTRRGTGYLFEIVKSSLLNVYECTKGKRIFVEMLCD
ncbi:unnamed protein product [Cochlearia groenlandica]